MRRCAFAATLAGTLLLGALLSGTPAVMAQDDDCDPICQGILVDDVPMADVLDPGFDPDVAAAATGLDLAHDLDGDDDGLLDGDEALYAASPDNPDTDDDSISDGDEVHRYGTWPWTWDTDSDTVGDARELFEYRTNPNASDTDRDGYNDYQELYWYSTDPNDPGSYPASQGPRS